MGGLDSLGHDALEGGRGFWPLEGGESAGWWCASLPRRQPGGTEGYPICRDATQALLNYGKRMDHPFDDMLNRHWEHGVLMISMSPDIVRGPR